MTKSIFDLISVPRSEAVHVMDAVITLPIEEEDYCMFKIIDVMVTHPLVDSNLEAASEKSLAAANAGVKMKKKHYKAWSKYQHDHRTGQEFIPFVLETLGGMP